MRVLFGITKGEVGGAQEHLRILAQGLLAAGHEVAVMVHQPSPLAEAIGRMGGDVLPWHSIVGPVSPGADRRARRELGEAVEAWGPDILHVSSSKAGILGTGLLAAPRGATVFTCHHLPIGPGRLWRNRVVARPVLQFALPRMDGIITVGARDMPTIRRLAPKVPLRLIRNAVPFDRPPVSTGPLRPVALWVARLAHPKDPLLAISAWELVTQKVPSARLILCGTGPLDAQVRARLRRSPGSSSVEVRGFVDELSPLQAEASAFLLASSAEGGLTMATLDAMGQGLVPIVSDVGDAAQLEEIGAGICVRLPGPAPMAAALIELFADPERFDQLRAHALAYARVDRTPEHHVEETVSFYREVLDRSAGRVRRHRAGA